jgi:U3 small nucleolar RNA-associated protein MPP10
LKWLGCAQVAPVAVSEASMLAPEEIFVGEDGIKDESELTPEERKRRRAQKKRKRKGLWL